MFARVLPALVLLLVSAIGNTARGQTSPALNTVGEVGAFMQTYYQHPRPERIADVISALSPSGFLQKANNASTVVGFFSEIFAADPSRMPEWQARVAKQDDKTKALLERALQVSKTGGVLQITSHSPEVNDAYWAAFFASGNRKFIARLVDQLRYFDERNDQALFYAGATAKWSLASNAQSQPAVRSSIEDARSAADKRTQELIDELLNQDPESVKQEIRQILQAQRQSGKWK